MATDQPYFINKDKYDTLKQQMNFEQVVTTLPADKRVILDWPKLLTSFKDDENKQWTTSHPLITMKPHYAQLSTNIVSGKEKMSINIASFNQGQMSAIDIALRKATNSNATFISYKLQGKCMADFCLVPSIRHSVNFMKFVYGNILVELNHFGDEQEVLSVARYIQAAMEQAVAANPQQRLPARPVFTYKTEPARQKVGATFMVNVSPSERNPAWEFDVAEKLLTDNIEYEEDMGNNTYKFSVKSAGEGRVAFNLMDRKTLWVFTDTVMVDID